MVTIIVAVIVGIILVGIAVGYLWFQQTVRRGLPQTSGEMALRGLNERVEIIRDNYGVPHIYAKDEPDLYFAA